MSFDKQTNVAPVTDVGVSGKTAARIGLFGAVSIIIGGTVGVGIFFKNGSIFRNNNGNAAGIIISWVLAFIIAITIAYSYGEIVTCKTKSANSGLAGWFERFVGYRSGRLVKIMLPLTYYGTYMLTDSAFFTEAIFNCFYTDNNVNAHMGYLLLVAVAGIAIFATLNVFVSGALQKASNVTTIMKFIPLALVIFAGIIFGCINKNQNLFISGNAPAVGYSGQFSFTGILDSLPAILFAFDSFLVIGNIAGEMKNPQKNIPLSLVISMATAGVVYLLVTLGQICVGCGSAYAVFDFIFANNATAAKAFHIIVSIFIFISVFGVLNSMTMGAIRSFDSAIEEEIIVGSKQIKRIANGRYLIGGLIMLAAVSSIYVIVFGIPSIVLNTDQILDGISNFVVLIFFLIYGVLSFASILNRYHPKAPEIIKQKGQIVTSAIGAFGCVFVFFYGFIWQFFGQIIVDPSKPFVAWGLFHANPHTLVAWQACMWFWIMAAFTIIVPLLNEWLIKLTDKNYTQKLIWEKPEDQLLSSSSATPVVM